MKRKKMGKLFDIGFECGYRLATILSGVLAAVLCYVSCPFWIPLCFAGFSLIRCFLYIRKTSELFKSGPSKDALLDKMLDDAITRAMLED